MRIHLVLLVAAAVPMGVQAASVPGSVPSNVTVGQLARLQTRVAVLKQELEAANLRAEIAKAQAAMAKAEGTKHAGTGERPTVLSEYGRGPRDMRAVLGYPGGGTIVVRTGSPLPYGGHVVQVSSSGVVVTTPAGARHTLVFAAAPPAQVPAAPTGPMPLTPFFNGSTQNTAPNTVETH